MEYGIDSQVQARADAHRDNPNVLAQSYQQNQQLIDLLALQKIKSDKQRAMAELQAQNAQRQGQGQPPTVAGQREQEVMDMARQEVAGQLGMAGRKQNNDRQQVMQRLMQQGIASQSAPNMQKMAGGGIVSFQQGGATDEEEGNMLPPEELTQLFEESARRYDLPPELLMALAQQESSYRADAQGADTQWGNARGIMQYLDPTAESLGIDSLDPAQSVDAAARQLRERLDQGESMEDAVRHHFAGPNRERWGEKTDEYGRSVMGKASQIATQRGEGRPRQESMRDQVIARLEQSAGRTVERPIPQREPKNPEWVGAVNDAVGSSNTVRAWGNVLDSENIPQGLGALAGVVNAGAQDAGDMVGAAWDAAGRGPTLGEIGQEVAEGFTGNRSTSAAEPARNTPQVDTRRIETPEPARNTPQPPPQQTGPNATPAQWLSNQVRAHGSPAPSDYDRRMSAYRDKLSELQDPDRQRRERLKAFLLGAGNRTGIASALGAGALASSATGDRQDANELAGLREMLTMSREDAHLNRQYQAELDQIMAEQRGDVQEIVTRAALDRFGATQEDARNMAQAAVEAVDDDPQFQARAMEIQESAGNEAEARRAINELRVRAALDRMAAYQESAGAVGGLGGGGAGSYPTEMVPD